jgi:hypothetical protein
VSVKFQNSVREFDRPDIWGRQDIKISASGDLYRKISLEKKNDFGIFPSKC